MPSPALRARLGLLGLGLLALAAGLVALFGDALWGDDPLGVVEAIIWPHAAPPPDLALEGFLPGQARVLSPAQAIAVNLASPLEPHNPAPPAFVPGWPGDAERGRAGVCLATALYYEADGEGEAGQLAVAQVILNRLRHPRYPKDVCAVVYQGAGVGAVRGGCQFTFACDGSLARRPGAEGMARARRVAERALGGATSLIAGQATHYHAITIVPVWAGQLRKVAILGHHVFYRPPVGYGGYPALGGGAGGPLAPVATPAPEQAARKEASSAERASIATVPAPAASAPSAPASGAAPAPSAPARPPAYFARPHRREGALPLPGNP